MTIRDLTGGIPLKALSSTLACLILLQAYAAQRSPANYQPATLLGTKNSSTVFPAGKPKARLKNPYNGIFIREVKLYDHRSLEAMLESARTALGNLKFIDQAAPAGALGKFQGGRQSDSNLSASISTLPTPAITTTTKTGATNSVEEEVKEDKVTPGASTAATTPAASFTPPSSFGVSAQDILAEQTALTFDVMNYSMLLERSVTDRVFVGETGLGTAFFPRARAVVGLNIGLENPARYKGMVAEVEITLKTNKPTDGDRASVVAMIPKEKTYNVATVSKKSTSFGGGAVVQVLNIGFNTTRSNQTLYLVKDTDMVAFERFEPLTNEEPAEGHEPDAQSVTFGWQFRPVLGQKSITPGPRHVFALLALPIAANINDFEGNVVIRTHWRRYKSSSNTVGDIKEGSQNVVNTKSLAIDHQMPVEQLLAPTIDDVTAVDSGNGQVIVDVTGTRFAPASQTKIMVGDTVLDTPEKGLAVLNDSHLRFVTSAQKLATVDPLLIGPFGVPVEISRPEASVVVTPPATPTPGLGINVLETKIEALDSQQSRVTLKLTAITKDTSGGASVEVAPLRLANPMVVVGSKVYGLGGTPLSISRDSHYVWLSFVTSTENLRAVQSITVKDPFRGKDYKENVPVSISDDLTYSKMTVISSDANSAQIAITGSGFTPDTELFLGDYKFVDGSKTHTAPEVPRMKVESSTLITLRPTQEQLKGVKVLVFRKGTAPPYIFPMESPAPIPEPKLTARGKVFQGDVGEIKLSGENLTSIAKVMFEDQELLMKVEKDGKSMTLQITRAVSDLVGNRQLVFFLNNGTSVKLKDPESPDKFVLVVEKRP